MPCESPTIDMNHNNWKKVARKLSFSEEEPPPDESQCTSPAALSHDKSKEKENNQSASDHEQQTESSKIDSQSLVQNKQTSRTSYAQLRLLKLGNVCQSSRRSRQPVVVLDPLTMKYKIRVIDYGSWQWQPNIPLNRLTDDELKNVDRSLLQSNQSEQPPIQPIKFDKDEELIRELSPDTAAERFKKQLEEIKKLNDEPSQPKTNNSTYRGAKKPRNKSRPEIDELDQRFRDMKPSKGKIGVRKLYNHEVNQIVQNENIGSLKSSSKKDWIRSGQRLGKKMPMRLAKQNISYID